MADTTIIKARVQYALDGDTTTLPLAIDFGSGRDWTSAVPTDTLQFRESVPTAGHTISLALFTAVSAVYLFNHDITNFVELAWGYLDVASAAHTNAARIPPGMPLLVPGPFTIASNLLITANTAACKCTVIVFGT